MAYTARGQANPTTLRAWHFSVRLHEARNVVRYDARRYRVATTRQWQSAVSLPPLMNTRVSSLSPDFYHLHSPSWPSTPRSSSICRLYYRNWPVGSGRWAGQARTGAVGPRGSRRFPRPSSRQGGDGGRSGDDAGAATMPERWRCVCGGGGVGRW